MTSKFIYLLNAMENAAQASDPAAAGYGPARQAVLDYVSSLEAPSRVTNAQSGNDHKIHTCPSCGYPHDPND